MLFVNRYYGMQRFEVPQTTGATEHLTASIFITPGKKIIAPGQYDCSQPGLYQIYTPVDDGVNAAYQFHRILAPDAYALATSVAWLNSFGWGTYMRPDGSLYTLGEITAAAVNSRISLPCGTLVEWTSACADNLGILHRTVHIVTAGTPNNFSDGHVSMEMFYDGAWRLFDPSLYWLPKLNGTHLNLYEAVENINSITFEDLAPFTQSPEAPISHRFLADGWIRAFDVWDKQKRIDNEIKRVYQIPFLEDSEGIWGYLPSGTESRESYILSLGYNLLSRADFIARFY